jgi:riboflavin kinase/FMN adenylyltransferase
MRVVRGLRLHPAPRRSVVAIGVFDGVHLGHQRLIAFAVRRARARRIPCVALTFHPDPQTVMTPTVPHPPLSTLRARLAALAALGVDVAWVIPFTRRFSRLPAAAFAERLLVRRARAELVVVGEDFAFGQRRQGTPPWLREFGGRRALAVVAMALVRRGGAPVSSTRIRRLLQAGDAPAAARLLGHPVELTGRIVRGRGQATALGFPTANVRLDGPTPLATGVYAVRILLRGRARRGVMNFGVRPTFGPGPLTCEVHVPGFAGSAYGAVAAITVTRRLRPERRFRSIGALVQQIRRDIARAGRA